MTERDNPQPFDGVQVIDSGHDVQLTRPRELAEVLLQLT